MAGTNWPCCSPFRVKVIRSIVRCGHEHRVALEQSLEQAAHQHRVGDVCDLEFVEAKQVRVIGDFVRNGAERVFLSLVCRKR